jgi:hypothetical protein
VKKKISTGREGCSSAKRVERAHPQLVHWWLLVHPSPNPAFWVFDSLSILVSVFRNPVVQIDEFFRKSKNTHWAIFPSFLRKRDQSRSTMGRKEGARERIIQCAFRKIHENLPFSLPPVSTSHIPKGHASPLCLYTSLVLTQFFTEKPKTQFAN